uniref:Uncharacterized protein n=1 Tax=Globodera rostochiensis TaxID=31243 RepID=A0A914GWT6_GLORO
MNFRAGELPPFLLYARRISNQPNDHSFELKCASTKRSNRSLINATFSSNTKGPQNSKTSNKRCITLTQKMAIGAGEWAGGRSRTADLVMFMSIFTPHTVFLNQISPKIIQ